MFLTFFDTFSKLFLTEKCSKKYDMHFYITQIFFELQGVKNVMLVTDAVAVDHNYAQPQNLEDARDGLEFRNYIEYIIN